MNKKELESLVEDFIVKFSPVKFNYRPFPDEYICLQSYVASNEIYISVDTINKIVSCNLSGSTLTAVELQNMEDLIDQSLVRLKEILPNDFKIIPYNPIANGKVWISYYLNYVNTYKIDSFGNSIILQLAKNINDINSAGIHEAIIAMIDRNVDLTIADNDGVALIDIMEEKRRFFSDDLKARIESVFLKNEIDENDSVNLCL